MSVKNKPLQIRKLIEGKALTICELVQGDKSAFQKFVRKISKEKRSRITGHFKSFSDNGTPSNTERFTPEEDGIYAYKDFQVRIYCFFHEGNLLILTHGTIKKQDKADPEDLKRAKRVRKEFLEELP